MVQLQGGQRIQLAADGTAPEFPEGPAKDSQLLLSATFLTAELALLQKSLEVKLKDKRVSCHHSPPASAAGVPGSACPGHLGMVQNCPGRCGAAWGFNGSYPCLSLTPLPE